MKSPHSFSRLLAGLTAASALVAGSLAIHAEAIPEDAKIGGFAIGSQAYTFNRFTLFEAIEKNAAAGAKVIEMFPGQRVSTNLPASVKWDQNASDDLIAQVKEKLAKHHVRAVNYGVVGISKNEDEARKLFEFAKKMGFYGLTTESTESIDTIEKLVKEYDICVGYHDHPRQDNNPNYKVWDPNYIAELVKGRDPRVGSCADIGHWQTSGLKPLDCLKILEGRIISLHLKERPAIGPGQHDVPFGAGATGMGEIFAELRRQNFKGNMSIEYEYNWDNSVTDVAQCIGFVRGWAYAQPK